jgi:hypothetical protein
VEIGDIMDRPSMYLTPRIDALSQSISFYRNRLEHLVCFMVQLDFWDLEMSSLILSFKNYAEHARDWSRIKTIKDGLKKQDIKLRPDLVEEIRWKRIWRFRKDEIFAPFARINQLIDIWNATLDDAAELMNKYSYDPKEAATMLKDLEQYKKKHLRNE